MGRDIGLPIHSIMNYASKMPEKASGASEAKGGKRGGLMIDMTRFHDYEVMEPCVGIMTCGYRLRLISSFSISSTVVMILELAWKPRWVAIILTNSCPISTVDCSRA